MDLNINPDAIKRVTGAKKIPTDGTRHVTRKRDSDRMEMDLRAIRRKILSVFDEIGGADRLIDWVVESDKNYEKFMLQIVIPLLPKEVNEDGVRIQSDKVTLQFNKDDYYQYLKEANEPFRGD